MFGRERAERTECEECEECEEEESVPQTRNAIRGRGGMQLVPLAPDEVTDGAIEWKGRWWRAVASDSPPVAMLNACGGGFCEESRPRGAQGEANVMFETFHIDANGLPLTSPTPVRERATLAAVICVYNEEDYMLQRSLNSLQLLEPTPLVLLDVMISVDGIAAMHPSLKMLLKHMFGASIPVEETQWQALANPNQQTYVTNRMTPGGGLLSLLLKRNNRKKVNSHEWFFRSFGHPDFCSYGLASDCGTVIPPLSLHRLYSHLDTHPKCIAVSGWQRIMSLEQMAPPTAVSPGTLGALPEKQTTLQRILHAIQLWECEAEHCGSKPVWGLLGFLPVLPGPCSIYRVHAMQGACLDAYFSLAESRPCDVGLVEANLKLAEDRIPNFYSVFANAKGMKAAWVPGAPYYVEAELSVRALVAQRRRWINGAWAGSIFVCSQFRTVTGSEHGFWFKVAAFIMLALQQFTYLVTYLSPGSDSSQSHIPPLKLHANNYS